MITVHLNAVYNTSFGDINLHTDGDGYVSMRICAEDDIEPYLDRSLSPEEARGLAAVLCHFANELER